MAKWLIWLDNRVIHQPVTTERTVTAATLAVAMDSAGTLEVDVPTSHPEYAAIASLPVLGRNVWRVERDGAEVFRGRTLSRERDPLGGAVHVVIEGELAILNDSLRLPYSFEGETGGTCADYLRMLVANHNAQVDEWKRFSVGRVKTGTDGSIVRGSESTATTWEELADKTFGSSVGGHIVLRRGTRTIDWLDAVAEPCDQPVKLGYNLLAIADEVDGAELATAIHAVGADVNGTRIEIAATRTGGAGVTVRGGYLVNDALAADHGIVVREVVWDDVTLEPNLWSRALEYAQALAVPRTVTVKAVDMSDAGYAVDAFDVGQVVALDALDTQGRMQVTAIEWDLLDPAGGHITFGAATVTSSARAATTTQTADSALYVAGSSAGGGGGTSPSPYDSAPEMDGTATAGASDDYARGDHVHPHDTTKQDALAVSATTATRGSAASTISVNSVRRYGKVVQVTLAGIKLASALSTGSTSGTVATVPSGYRPTTNVYAAIGSTGAHGGSYARITDAGVVTIRNSSGTSIATSAELCLTITYIIA